MKGAQRLIYFGKSTLFLVDTIKITLIPCKNLQSKKKTSLICIKMLQKQKKNFE